MSVHEDNENRVNQLISDSFQKKSEEFPPFLEQLKSNEIKETQESEKKLISDIENSLRKDKNVENLTEDNAKKIVHEALQNKNLDKIAEILSKQMNRTKDPKTTAEGIFKENEKLKINEKITDLVKYDDLLPDNLGLFLSSNRSGFLVSGTVCQSSKIYVWLLKRFDSYFLENSKYFLIFF